MRAEERSRTASSLTRNRGTPCFSLVSVRRRDAVKSSALGLPTISPITKASSWQRSPSSMAKRASSAFSAHTWTIRACTSSGKPARYGRPTRRTASRVWTHNTLRRSCTSQASARGRLRQSSSAKLRANPAPTPSREEAKTSLCSARPCLAAKPGHQRMLRCAERAATSSKAVDGMEAESDRDIGNQANCSHYVPYPIDSQFVLPPPRSGAPKGTLNHAHSFENQTQL